MIAVLHVPFIVYLFAAHPSWFWNLNPVLRTLIIIFVWIGSAYIAGWSLNKADHYNYHLGGVMSKPRPYKKYDVIVNGKIIHSGITKDLKRRAEEHKNKWHRAQIRQVGGSVTEESAKEWEKTKKKA